MSDVPSEIVTNILLTLQVKPLLRFRCVSKAWCALIDSPAFIKLHLNRSIQTNSNTSLFLGDCCLKSVDLDSLDNAVKLTHPLKSHEFVINISGSSNGLLCMYHWSEYIFFWNPSTRKHYKLPVADMDTEFPHASKFGRYINYGFGYDPVNDDYKVVRMIGFYNIEHDDSFYSEVKVYSLKSNSWRRIQDFPYYSCYRREYGVFANGALHWDVSVKSKSPESDYDILIVAFDLGTEEFRSVPLPEYSGKNFHMSVEVLGGCLCVISRSLHYVDIWVMKDYGVKESWTKLISLAQSNDSIFQVVLPIAYSKSGDQVLLEQDHKSLVWYDLKRKTLQNVRICGLPNFFESNVYVGSLVKLPNGGGGTNAKNHLAQEKRKKEKKKNKQAPKKRCSN